MIVLDRNRHRPTPRTWLRIKVQRATGHPRPARADTTPPALAPPPAPRVVVCGSMAHPQPLADAVAAETAAGHTVVACPVRDTRIDPGEWARRIFHADRVVIVTKPGGGLGETTTADLDHALNWGRQVVIRETRPAPERAR